MPPLKNGSLGRGLGDLIGELPQTIGVARHPVPVMKPPASVRSEKPPAPPAAISGRAAERMDGRVFRGTWPFISGLAAMLVVGFGMGLFVANPSSAPRHPPAAETPARLVMVTNVVVVSSATPRAKPAESLEFLSFKPNWIRASETIR